MADVVVRRCMKMLKVMSNEAHEDGCPLYLHIIDLRRCL
jgi:predicted urease superfamily metal-dependent hydrolase